MLWHIPQGTLQLHLNTGIHPLIRVVILAGRTAHQRLLQPRGISVGRKGLPGLKEQQERLGHKGLKGQQERQGHKARPGLHSLDILMADSRPMGYSLPLGLRMEDIIATGIMAGIL